MPETLLSMVVQPSGETLIPVALWADEAISQPFVVTLELLSQNDDINATAMLYQPVCVEVTGSGVKRFFHGMIRKFAFHGAAQRDFASYTAEVVPRLWFMSQTGDCRVFQQQSAVEILRTLFSDAGITDLQVRITGDQPQREYTVQWNETDLDFATRLMEEEGYFYFFNHSASAHTLVLANSNQAFASIEPAEVQINPNADWFGALSSWQPASATAWGMATLKDYDPTASRNKQLESTQNTVQQVASADKRDVFHWAALTFEPGEVSSRARRLMEAAEASSRLVEGSGFHLAFVAGGKFTLAEDPQTGEKDQENVIRGVFHRATAAAPFSTAVGADYANSFTCFQAKQTWREEPRTPRPRMHGIYSAVVIGPDGEEIYTDQYGRVQVLFPWDHRKDSTAGRSVWLRVVQPWAGNQWGWQYIPRVGTEVAVAFMDGDIDRPVVVGGLYDADYMPPFPLPDQKTKSGLRTRSSLQGGSSNFSEFSIDDKMGEELVFLHAEKDHTIEVEHDQQLTVDNCRIKTVKADEKVTIGGNQTIEIQNGNRDVKIDTGNDSLLLQQGNLSTKLSMGNMTVELSMGNVSTKADLGEITENAMRSITMTVGENSIKIDQTGVTISGLMVSIKGQVQTQVQGTMTQVSGTAMTQISGGILMIG